MARDDFWASRQDAGFIHRIDAVPDAGREIIFIDHADEERVAMVVDTPIGSTRLGAGNIRRLKHAAAKRLLVPSQVMVWWKYK